MAKYTNRYSLFLPTIINLIVESFIAAFLNFQDIIDNLRKTTILGYTPDNEYTKNFTGKIQAYVFETYKKSLVWLPFEDDQAIETYAAQVYLKNQQGESENNQFYGALVFDGLRSLDPKDYSQKQKISYTVRLKDYFYPTQRLSFLEGQALEDFDCV